MGKNLVQPYLSEKKYTIRVWQSISYMDVEIHRDLQNELFMVYHTIVINLYFESNYKIKK